MCAEEVDMKKEQIILQRIADHIHKSKTPKGREATIAMISPYLSVGLNIPQGSVKQILEEMLSHKDIMGDLEESQRIRG